MTAEISARRPDLFVVARFLDKLWHEEGTPPPRWSKSRLQPAVRLNYDLFRRYLAVLESYDFVRVENGGRGETHIALTRTGRRAHERLVRFVYEVFGPDALDPRGPPDPRGGNAKAPPPLVEVCAASPLPGPAPPALPFS